jgi:hypothetical protein
MFLEQTILINVKDGHFCEIIDDKVQTINNISQVVMSSFSFVYFFLPLPLPTSTVWMIDT